MDKKSTRKTKIVHVRMTPEQKKLIQKAASSSVGELSLSTWMLVQSLTAAQQAVRRAWDFDMDVRAKPERGVKNV